MQQLRDITVLITGAGAPGAPGIIKSLRLNGERKIKIIGVDMQPDISVGATLADKIFKVPPGNSDNFIETILNIAKAEHVDVILPLVTSELYPFALNKKLFEQNNIKLQISDPEPLVTANNKHSLMEFAKKNGIACPEFFLVKNIVEFKQKALYLGYPKRKICFKPPVSNGLRGFRIICEQKNKMEALLNEKPNNVYIGFNEFISMAEECSFFPELLIMEYLPGKEYSVDVLVDQGKCIKVIPRSRDYLKMGISFAATTVKNTGIIRFSKILVEKLKLNGNIGLQFKEDSAGIPKLIECNPRLQGTIVLCTAAGYNMVYNSVKIALGEKPLNTKIKWGTKMFRFWDEIYKDPKGNVFRI